MSDSHETESKPPESTNSVKRFFSKPIVAIVGSISGVIGIILSVSFYLASRTSPDLIYCVDSARAAVVRANQSSRLHIELDGEVVKKDVTAAQIIIWNDGEESIRGKNLLSPFVVKTGPLNPIIEADIQKVTRGVVGLRLDKSKIGEGQLGVDWTILEQGDGAMLQLIYFGDDQTSITASGTVEQQGDVRELEDRKEVIEIGALGQVAFLFFFFFVIMVSMIASWEELQKTRSFSSKVFILVQIVLVAMVAIYIYYWWAEPSPPFRF